MRECTRIIINSFHLFLTYFFFYVYLLLCFFNKGFVMKGEGGLKTNKKGDGQESCLSLCSLCEKDCLIFQTENRVPSDK